MAFLFGRVKNWIKNETLKSPDLNAEFNNLLNNASLPNLSGFSATVGQMQTQVNPGSQGSESLSQTASDELARLRFAISRIVGGTYWYDTPATSLDNVLTLLGNTAPPPNRITSGLKRSTSNQPAFLVANGSNLTAKLKGSVTPFVFYVAGTQYTINTDVTITCQAGSASDTAAVNDASLSGQLSSQIQGEGSTAINFNGASGSFANPTQTFAAFQLTHSASTEYFFAYVRTNTQLVHAYRGYFFDSTYAPISRLAMSNTDALLQLKTNWIFATTALTLDKTTNPPRVAFTQPSSPNNGDYWYDLTNNIWKKYNGTTFIASNATLIGIAICNSTACVASRSFDFYAPYDSTWTGLTEIQDNNTVRTTQRGVTVNVAGNVFHYDQDLILWVKPTNLDTGISDGNNLTFYLYLKDTGDVVLSTVVPFDRSEDLRGFYHPFNPWRCVGQVTNDGSSHFNSNLQGPNSADRLAAQMGTAGTTSLIATMSTSGADSLAQNMSSVGANAIAVTRTRATGTTVAVGGVAVSASSSTFRTTSASSTPVTNLTVTLATSGRPVFVGLMANETGHTGSFVETEVNSQTFLLSFLRGGTPISELFYETQNGAANYIPCSSFSTVDLVAAGTYTYTVNVTSDGTNGVKVQYTKLIAYEL